MVIKNNRIIHEKDLARAAAGRQGNIGHLRPGIGYEFKVSSYLSFSCGKSCNLT